MTLATLRRATVILVLGLLVLAALSAAITSIASSVSSYSSSSSDAQRLDGLTTIVATLEHQRQEISNQQIRQSIPAESASVASSHMQTTLQAAVDEGGGALLSVQGSPAGAIIRLQWLWRGDESEMRAMLTALNEAMPNLEYEQFQLRRVEMENEPFFEIDAIGYQGWRPE
ncbi:GspMb/PilO family protein [Hyphobacterium sp.]|uniref:GspMb/PilO family protein n=1 Tax=Hyphobacterium sp. TaxID=2004662 RepID=UPI0037478BAA